MKRVIAALVAVSAIAATGAAAAGPAPRTKKAKDGRGDATVIAILDFGLNPYHWDFLADKMPQHQNGTRSDDLPLDTAPDKWLPGFPDPKKEFASYNELDLQLESKNPQERLETLKARDASKWATVQKSGPGALNYYWMPGTKVIGAMTFASSDRIIGTYNDHGVGTTSSAVGNIHGTCPECLLFFIELGSVAESEAAIEWAMEQPWIDAISNSYGFSAAYRDRVYSGSNVEAQAEASERGQTIFFSAGNGNDGAFAVPNTTSFSSQEGPDWIVTVGAVSPGEDNYYYQNGAGVDDPAYETAYHASYSGHGKPSDVAGIGGNYPSAYYAQNIGETGTNGFGGTSNATPQVTGTYARALYLARRAMAGASKIQSNGVIAKGRFKCSGKRKDCELRDGALTAVELRARFFEGAVHTEAGTSAAGVGNVPNTQEEEFMNEGHGSYFGLETGSRDAYLEELDRILGPLFGRSAVLERPAGELEWMIVDSYCRQKGWGSWNDGYYQVDRTDLPADDPNWPLRTSYKNGCR